METKKSWISYVWWFLFSVCAVVLMVQEVLHVSNYAFADKELLMQVGLAGLSFVIAIICGVTVYAISRGCGNKQFGRWFFFWTEIEFWVAVVVLFYFRFFYRMVPRENIDTQLLYSALIQNGKTGREVLSGISALYVDVLSVFFSFVGNNAEMVFYLQFILQILTVILIYFAVRLLCGRVAAYGTGLLLICSEQWIDAVMRYEPEMIYMLMWSLILLLLGVFYHYKVLGKWFVALFAGVICGVLSYYDILGLLLLVIGIYLFYAAAEVKKTVFLLIGFAAGCFTIFFQEVFVNQQRWYSQYTILPGPVIAFPEESILMLAVIVIFSGFLMASFWLNTKRRQSISVWVAAMLLVCVIGPVLGIAALRQEMWVTLTWSILAGFGLQGVIKAGMEAGSMKRAETKATGAEAEWAETVQEEPSRYDTSTGIEYIENPLPLPPKPVKKGMDFPFDIPAEKLYYDVKVAEDADYDLKE